jgi:hypothetical protein
VEALIRGIERDARTVDGAAEHEDLCARVETVVMEALDGAAREGRVSLPGVPIEIGRLSMLLEEFEKPRPEERAYLSAFQEKRDVLAASFAPIIRAAAMYMESEAKTVEASVFWRRVLELLNSVVPNSELAALTASKVLLSRLNAMRLDPSVVIEELGEALTRSHMAYGGGVEVFLFLNSHCFTPELHKSARQHPALATFCESPAPLVLEPKPAPPVPEKTEKAKTGFFEELKRKKEEADASTPEVEIADGVLKVYLPDVKGDAIDLQASEDSFRLRAGPFFLEKKVRVDMSSAKFKKGVLTLKLAHLG